MAQPPAARTLRYQSVRSPHGIGTTKPSATGRTTTTVWKIDPERRRRCSMTPYSGKKRIPAKRNIRELNRRAGPERMSLVDMVVGFSLVSPCECSNVSGGLARGAHWLNPHDKRSKSPAGSTAPRRCVPGRRALAPCVSVRPSLLLVLAGRLPGSDGAEVLHDPHEVLDRVEVGALLARYQRLYAFSPPHVGSLDYRYPPNAKRPRFNTMVRPTLSKMLTTIQNRQPLCN